MEKTQAPRLTRLPPSLGQPEGRDHASSGCPGCLAVRIRMGWTGPPPRPCSTLAQKMARRGHPEKSSQAVPSAGRSRS
eukprot:1518423-Pyramimonas_sp.AAC.1